MARPELCRPYSLGVSLEGNASIKTARSSAATSLRVFLSWSSLCFELHPCFCASFFSFQAELHFANSSKSTAVLHAFFFFFFAVLVFFRRWIISSEAWLQTKYPRPSQLISFFLSEFNTLLQITSNLPPPQPGERPTPPAPRQPFVPAPVRPDHDDLEKLDPTSRYSLRPRKRGITYKQRGSQKQDYSGIDFTMLEPTKKKRKHAQVPIHHPASLPLPLRHPAESVLHALATSPPEAHFHLHLHFIFIFIFIRPQQKL